MKMLGSVESDAEAGTNKVAVPDSEPMSTCEPPFAKLVIC